MTDITKTNEYDEVELTPTPETLWAINALFDNMVSRAEELFRLIEARYRQTTNYRWDYENYTYDRFSLDGGCIMLHGSYDTRCNGTRTTEHSVNFDQFFDPKFSEDLKAAIASHDAEKIATAKAEAEAATAAAALAQEEADRTNYARLKAKFGESV